MELDEILDKTNKENTGFNVQCCEKCGKPLASCITNGVNSTDIQLICLNTKCTPGIRIYFSIRTVHETTVY